MQRRACSSRSSITVSPTKIQGLGPALMPLRGPERPAPEVALVRGHRAPAAGPIVALDARITNVVDEVVEDRARSEVEAPQPDPTEATLEGRLELLLGSVTADADLPEPIERSQVGAAGHLGRDHVAEVQSQQRVGPLGRHHERVVGLMVLADELGGGFPVVVFRNPMLDHGEAHHLDEDDRRDEPPRPLTPGQRGCVGGFSQAGGC